METFVSAGLLSWSECCCSPLIRCRLKEMEADSILLPPNDFRKDSYLNLPFLLQIFLIFLIISSFALFLHSFRNETVFIYRMWLLLLLEL